MRGRLQPLQPADDLPQGPDRLAQPDHVPLEAVDVVEELPAGLVDERVLDAVDLLAELLEDEEIVVDDRVDDGVGQVVGAEGPDAALAAPDPLADRAEAVPGRLLERDDVVRAEDQAELVGRDVPPVRVALDHPQDDEDRVPQVLDLGALGRRHDVLEDERVDLEPGAELLDDGGVLDAVDVDPGHRRRLLEREALLDRGDLLLEEVGRVVIDDRDAGLPALLVADVHQRPGLEPRFVRTPDLVAGHVALLADFPLRIDLSTAVFQRIEEMRLT